MPYRAARLRLSTTLLVAASACGSTTDPTTGTHAPDLPIAVISSPGQDARQSQLILVSADGQTARTGATFTGSKGLVRWSPDGTRLAFTGVPDSATGTGRDLWVVNADGTGLHQVSTDDRGTDFFLWLPDGRILRHQSTPPGVVPPGGWVVAPAGAGGALPVTAANGLTVGELAVSADGTRAAFLGLDGLYAAQFDGTGARRVGVGEWPRWSPSGDRLAYLTTSAPGAGGQWAVAVVRADATGAPVVIPTGAAFFATDLTWSRDGARVAWIAQQDQGYRALSAAADGSGSGSATAVIPRSAGVTPFDWSVDWRPTAAP